METYPQAGLLQFSTSSDVEYRRKNASLSIQAVCLRTPISALIFYVLEDEFSFLSLQIFSQRHFQKEYFLFNNPPLEFFLPRHLSTSSFFVARSPQFCRNTSFSPFKCFRRHLCGVALPCFATSPLLGPAQPHFLNDHLVFPLNRIPVNGPCLAWSEVTCKK